MLIIILQTIVAILIASNTTNSTTQHDEYELSFRYVEINDITNANNEFENMRSTIEICYAINYTRDKQNECASYAFIRATTIHA